MARHVEAAPIPRLALSPDGVAASLGYSRAYCEENGIFAELDWVIRGSRRFVPVTEVQRWLDENKRPILEG